MKNITPEFMFHRGSTPSLAFDLPDGLDVSQYTVKVSFAQNYETLLVLDSKQNQIDVDNDKVYVTLEIEDTKLFRVGDLDVQIHYVGEDASLADHSFEKFGLVLRTHEGVD